MRFCLLSLPGTGSTRLAGLLDSHARIICHNELFQVPRPTWSKHCLVPTSLDQDLDRRRDDPLGWLEEVFAATAGAVPDARAIGFKLQITDRPRVLEYILLDSDMKLVLLYRANRLAQYASARAAAATGRWASSNAGWRLLSPVGFDLEDFQRFVGQQALATDLVQRLVRDKSRLFVIEYQELEDALCRASLLAFLGQDYQPLMTPDERLGSSIIRERFAEPEKVASALKQTVWRPWLERDGS